MGRLVIQSIIPTVDRLRLTYPLRFTTMFSQNILRTIGLPKELCCSDIEETDVFFESMKYQ